MHNRSSGIVVTKLFERNCSNNKLYVYNKIYIRIAFHGQVPSR